MAFLSVECKNTQCHIGHLQPSEHCHFFKLYMSTCTMWKKLRAINVTAGGTYSHHCALNG